MSKVSKMRQAAILALILALAWLIPLYGYAFRPVLTASAVSADYPVPLFNLASKDNSKVLTETSAADTSPLTMKALGNDLSPSWRIDRVGSDSNGTFFKFINAQSGRLLTPLNYNVKSGTDVVIYGSESAKSQHWYIVPVSKDHLGNNLYYKVVNYVDTSLALTQGNSGITLESYTGADSQLWLLNADGLQGFAGYCFDDAPNANGSTIKASDIGGLFGEVVEVSNFDDLKKYATAEAPYTIIINNDIKISGNYKLDGQNHYYCPDGRIYVTDNKTIVGSYGKHTLYNVQFCTKQGSGKGNNLITKNLDLQHDKDSNGNDNIIVYFGSGQNLWVDHCTFTGHQDYNKASSGQPDYDKFLACCYDADYCTISECSFGLHEYGLILGYPDDTASVQQKYDNFPRMTISGNKFYQTYTRGPGLMRWGYFHSLNNYVDTFNMAYTVHSGCDIYAENCFYANGGNVICDWNEITYTGYYAESGSKFSNCQRTVQGQGTQSNPARSKPSGWRPNTNYNYTSISADNTKNYCNSYSGCQSSTANMMYLRFGKAGVPSAGYTELPSGPMAPSAASFTEGSTFTIKNAKTGNFIGLGIGTGSDPYVIQTEADQRYSPVVWKLFSAGDGYYYIALDGDVLEVPDGSPANDIGLKFTKYTGKSSQQFKFIEDSDNTYTILTKASEDGSALTANGSAVTQNEATEADSQKWILEATPENGCTMDTDVIYTFRNVNSGLVMDIENGAMENGTNVRQWESNGFDCQKWILQHDGATGSSNIRYFIISAQDENYALRAEGTGNGANIDIAPFSTMDDQEVFTFSKNLDGSYSILSYVSGNKCYVEVDAAKTEAGANIQQYSNTGSSCQFWDAVTETRTETTTTTTATTTTTTTTETTTTTTTTTTETTTTTTTTTTETTTTTTTSELPTDITATLVGDSNCDNDINLADAVYIMQSIANPDKYQLTEQGKANADTDGSGDITNMDALNIQKYKLGLIEKLA